MTIQCEINFRDEVPDRGLRFSVTIGDGVPITVWGFLKEGRVVLDYTAKCWEDEVLSVLSGRALQIELERADLRKRNAPALG